MQCMLTHPQRLEQTTVAILLCCFATLPQFALAQVVAPEFDPFAASDPFATPPSKAQRPVLNSELDKKAPPSSASKLHSPDPSLMPLRVLQLGESKPGGTIASMPSDPYMTAEQESRILAALKVPDEFDWDGISLVELRRVLKSRLPIWLNRSELGIAGIDVEAPIQNAGDIVAGPIGDRLACVLSQANDASMGFAIRANRLEISSREAIDAAPSVRIYDVTPLVLRIRAGKRVFDFEKLCTLIQSTLEPDSWLSAGGTSVISELIVGEPSSERSLIVVSAPTALHLQLQPLLDRLNSVK
ncbi:MAG: hypothetical protein SFV81_17085 [Pirellulaceae bacterium]|nr:hypothetical protein [Pirellulaceae bacterium]